MRAVSSLPCDEDTCRSTFLAMLYANLKHPPCGSQRASVAHRQRAVQLHAIAIGRCKKPQQGTFPVSTVIKTSLQTGV